MSVIVEGDVGQARSRMNFSRWNHYSREDQEAILTAIAGIVRTREMPPSRYTLIHPEARLSEENRALISMWARGERRRLRAIDAVPTGAGY